jgi:hypothetical protein
MSLPTGSHLFRFKFLNVAIRKLQTTPVVRVRRLLDRAALEHELDEEEQCQALFFGNCDVFEIRKKSVILLRVLTGLESIPVCFALTVGHGLSPFEGLMPPP